MGIVDGDDGADGTDAVPRDAVVVSFVMPLPGAWDTLVPPTAAAKAAAVVVVVAPAVPPAAAPPPLLPPSPWNSPWDKPPPELPCGTTRSESLQNFATPGSDVADADANPDADGAPSVEPPLPVIASPKNAEPDDSGPSTWMVLSGVVTVDVLPPPSPPPPPAVESPATLRFFLGGVRQRRRA